MKQSEKFRTMDYQLTPIQKHFENSNVFITGVTGFIGKYLMEKLLRTCPQVNKIYILLRPKKNKTIHERFEVLLQDPVFEKIRALIPDLKNRFVLISGDLSMKNLGISVEDQQLMIDSVNVVLHSAATVNFNEPMPIAVRTNVAGTKDLLLIARQMKNLKSFVYISTAYSNCNKPVICERFYDVKISGDDMIKLVDAVDEEMCEKITPIDSQVSSNSSNRSGPSGNVVYKAQLKIPPPNSASCNCPRSMNAVARLKSACPCSFPKMSNTPPMPAPRLSASISAPQYTLRKSV